MTQENPYIIQFPDLMRGKKIMYIHGFGSSAQSGTVKRIKDALPNAVVIAYDMPLHPADAMALLYDVCEREKPDLIIGTSMGGMYAEMLYGIDRICVNPAFQMFETMKEHGMTGKQLWQNPRADGETEFIVTKALEKEYRDVCMKCFEHAAEDNDHVYGLFGDSDPVVHTFGLFCEHYTQAMHFHGEHRMDDSAFLHGVVPVIRWISDKQEGRERPCLYIAADTLKDSFGRPKSSMVKTYEQLIETFDVRIVAPCPTNRHQDIEAMMTWAEEYLSTPAHDRVIFTNQPQNLIGDYLISAAPCDNFMGTVIEFGSDTFKTWEDIKVFFSRIVNTPS